MYAIMKGGENAHTTFFLLLHYILLPIMLNVPLILPKIPCPLIHVHQMDSLFAAYYWQLLLFMPCLSSCLSPALLSVIGLQEEEATSIPICSYSFFQSYLRVLSGHSCTLLYALLVLRIRRAFQKTVCQISTMGSSLLQGALSSPLIPPVSQQSQRIMSCICTIAPFACDDDKRIPG